MSQQIVGNGRSIRAQLPDGTIEIDRVAVNDGGGALPAGAGRLAPPRIDPSRAIGALERHWQRDGAMNEAVTVGWLTIDPNFWNDLVQFATPGAVVLVIASVLSWVLFR